MGIWQDIRDTLEGEIAAGRYPVGARLPGELALAQRFGVNRHTVRRALAALTEAGRIHVRRGAGATVLAPPLDYALTGSAAGGPRFSRNVAAAGRRPGRRLVRLETVAASAEDARLLDIAPGAPVALIETVGLADDVAVSVGLSRLPADRLPGIEAVLAARFAGGTQTPATPGSDAVAAGDGGTITAALSAAGCTAYRRAWTRIGARAAEPGEARHLMVAPGSAVLVSDGLDVDAAGRPVNAARAVFAAERVALVVGDAGLTSLLATDALAAAQEENER